MNNSTCPACGSSGVRENTISDDVQVDCYQTFRVIYNVIECDTCGYSGDRENGTGIDDALKEEKKKSDLLTIKRLAEEMRTSGSSDSFIERVFNLPTRTVNRWKSQGHSSSALALLKILKTYPWISKVAENGYSPKYAECVLFEQVSSLLHEYRLSEGDDCNIKVSYQNTVLDGSGNSSRVGMAAIDSNEILAWKKTG